MISTALRRLIPLKIILGVSLTGPLAAQEIPLPVEPGRVVSWVVRLPLPTSPSLEGASVPYLLLPDSGVRLHTDETGSTSREGDSVRIPLALSTRSDHLAGVQRALIVRLFPNEAEQIQHHLMMEVLPRPNFELHLAPLPSGISPGEMLTVPYRVMNTGNTSLDVRLSSGSEDGWWQDLPQEPISISPGEEFADSATLRSEWSAAVGETRVVQIKAEADGIQKEQSIIISITAGEQGWRARWAEMPLDLGLGTAYNLSQKQSPYFRFSLQGTARVGEDANLDIAWRERTGTERSLLLGGLFPGPAHRLRYWDSQNILAVGDIQAPVRLGSFASLHGEGITGRRETDNYRLDAFWVRPSLSANGESLGWLQAGTRNLVPGTLGLALAGGPSANPISPDSLSWTNLALLDYSYRSNGSAGHTLDLRAGGAHNSDLGSGLIGDVQYSFIGERSALSASARQWPSSLPGSRLGIREATLSGEQTLSSIFRLRGWGFHQCALSLFEESSRCARGLSGQLRYHSDLLSLGVVGGYQKESRPDTTSTLHRKHVGLTGTVPLGRILLQGQIERAWQDTPPLPSTPDSLLPPGSLDLRRSPSGWTWSGSAEWNDRWGRAWVDVRRFENWVLFAPPPRLDAGVELARDGWQWQTSYGRSLGSGSDEFGSTGWSRLRIPLGPTRSMSAGVEFNKYPGMNRALNASPWTFSLSFSQRLDIPLPLPAVGLVHGVVFVDRNGNGFRDNGEPGVPGAEVRRGQLSARTDSTGHYFLSGNATGQSLSLSATSLPSGLTVAPSLALRSRGRQDIPVVSMGSLRVHILEVLPEEDGRVRRNAALAAVRLESREGRVYPLQADERGIATLISIPPGTYKVSVVLAPDRLRRDIPYTLPDIEILANEEQEAVLRVPVEERVPSLPSPSLQ